MSGGMVTQRLRIAEATRTATGPFECSNSAIAWLGAFTGTGFSALIIGLYLSYLLTCWSTGLAINGSFQPAANSIQAQNRYRLGMRLVQEKHLDGAITVFKEGLQSSPNNVILLNALGAAYSLKQNTDEAKHYFLKALEINSQFAPARKNLGITYFDSGEYGLAKAQFERVSRDSDRDRPLAFLFLGMIASKGGNYGEAVGFFRGSRGLALQYPDSILSLAQSLYKLNQLSEAQLVLNKLNMVPGVSAEQWFEAGRLDCALEQYEPALEDFGRARKLNPSLPDVDYLRAYALSKLGRSHDALAILEDLTAREPNPDPLNLLGHLAQEAGNVQLSLDAYRRALEVAPQSEQNYLDYSTLCMGYGNTALGLEVVRRGLEHLPRSYRLKVQEGAFLASLGRLDEAQGAFHSAMSLDSNSKEAFLGLAITQASRHQFNEALKTYAEGVKRFPNDFNLNFYYALGLLRKAQNEGSRQQSSEILRSTIAKAIQLNPRSGGAYYLRAKYYTLIEPDPGKAIENLETCLRLQPRYVPAMYQLGLLYARVGKRRAGEGLLKQVREVQAEELKREQDHARIVIVARGSAAQTASGKELQ